MFDLLGTETPLAVKFFIAFAIVLALIGLTAWLVRRFGSNRLGTSRGRQPRLAVIDAAPIDGRRRLVLIRRDNIEHLLDDRRPDRRGRRTQYRPRRRHPRSRPRGRRA